MDRHLILTISLLIIILSGFTMPVLTKITPKQEMRQILVVYPPSDIGEYDLSGISRIDQALTKIESLHPNEINFTKRYPTTVGEGGQYISDSITGRYDLIVVIDFYGVILGSKGAGDLLRYQGDVRNLSQNNPEQQILLLNGLVDGSSIRSIFYLEHEGSFLAGALAAMVSNSSILGFISLIQTDIVNRYRYGFIQGANFIANSLGVEFEFKEKLHISIDKLDPYNSTLEMINEGADIIFTVAGNSNIEVFNAIEDYNENQMISEDIRPIFAIGSDNDQDFVKPGMILTSMVKRFEVALQPEIERFLDGNWINGQEFYGVKGNHLGLSEMVYTQSEKLAADERFNSHIRAELIQFLETAIVDKKINVSDDSIDSEINLGGDNPFDTSDSTNFGELILNNQLFLGSAVIALSLIISTFILRDRIIQVFRKSDKSKAIDYLDKAKKIAEEPEE